MTAKVSQEEIFDIFGGHISMDCLWLIQNWDSMTAEQRAEWGASEDGVEGFRQALQFAAKKHPAKDTVDQSVDWIDRWLEENAAYVGATGTLYLDAGRFMTLVEHVAPVMERYRHMRQTLRDHDIKLPDAI